MGLFEDRLMYARWERQMRLMSRAEEFLKKSGLFAPTRAVPLKLAVPLLQAVILEDNDELQDRWAESEDDLTYSSSFGAGPTILKGKNIWLG